MKPQRWIASTYLDRDGEWGILSTENEIIVGVSSRITEANARLMASAPEMFDALEEVIRVMRVNPQTDAVTLLSAVEECEAAIKTARGK